MKIKILITDTDKQLVLTPEDDFEKEACKLFDNMPNVYRSEFNETQGGYYREFGTSRDLIIRFPKDELEQK